MKMYIQGLRKPQSSCQGQILYLGKQLSLLSLTTCHHASSHPFNEMKTKTNEILNHPELLKMGKWKKA